MDSWAAYFTGKNMVEGLINDWGGSGHEKDFSDNDGPPIQGKAF
jgi:hypothetical protein